MRRVQLFALRDFGNVARGERGEQVAAGRAVDAVEDERLGIHAGLV